MSLTERPKGTALVQNCLQIEFSQVVQGMSEGLDDKTWQLVNFDFCSSPVEAACIVQTCAMWES